MDNVNQVHVVFDRSAQNPNEDTAIFTLHIRGLVDNLPDSLGSIDNTKRDTFAAAVVTFFNAIKGGLTTKLILSQIRFYEMGANATAHMGPPIQIKTYNAPGTSSGAVLPPQLSQSVTLKHPSTGGVGRTNSRWGRFYIPGVTTSTLDINGRFDPAWCTLVANAAVVLYRPVGGANGCKATIWSRKAWGHFDPNVVQVDDVPDVIRSRRFSSTNARSRVTV